jgi:nitrogen-specific signal transduction histidine kinase
LKSDSEFSIASFSFAVFKETYHFQGRLAELVAEAIEIELPGYAEHGESRREFPPDLPDVNVDIDKVKQVILNLAKTPSSNANRRQTLVHRIRQRDGSNLRGHRQRRCSAEVDI